MGRQNRNRALSATTTPIQSASPTERGAVAEEREGAGGTEMSRASEINAADALKRILEANGVRVLKLEHGATFTYRSPDEMQAVQAMVAGRPESGSGRSVGRVRPGAAEIDALFLVDRPSANTEVNLPTGGLWFFPSVAQPLPLWSSKTYEKEVGEIQRAWELSSASAFAQFLASLDPVETVLRVTTGEDDQPRFLIPSPLTPASPITGKRVVLEHTQSSNIRFKLPLLEKKLMNLGIREVARRGENYLDRQKVINAAIQAVSLVVFSSSALYSFSAEAQKLYTTWDAIASSGSTKFPILGALVRTGRLAVFFVKPALIRLMEDVEETKTMLREGLQEMREGLQEMREELREQRQISNKHGEILQMLLSRMTADKEEDSVHRRKKRRKKRRVSGSLPYAESAD